MYKTKKQTTTTNHSNYTTTKKEKTTGRVEKVPKYVTRFIDKDLRGRIVTTPLDGHCVGRAIGKLWNLQPG